MARIIPVGEPVNPSERGVIRHLRDHAPADWVVLHNVEVANHGRWSEIDLIVIAPHAVYVIDVKGTRGTIEVIGPSWYPSRRQPFRSPVPKLAGHAKTVKGLLTRDTPALSRLYVGELVVLTDPTAALVDPFGRDTAAVVRLDDLVAAIADRSRITGPFDTSGDLAAHAPIVQLLTGVTRAPQGPRVFGSWQAEEKLSESDDVTEYRGHNAALRDVTPPVRLRVYELDAYLDDEERDRQRHRIGNAFTTLSRLPAHPNIVAAHAFFLTEDESRAVLILDEADADALRPRLAAADALSMDTKLRIIGDVLGALDHAHRNRVIHRALSPDTVLVTPDDRAMLTGFDFARGGGPRPYTVVDQLPDVLDPAYLAPEGRSDLTRLTAASDLYALGVLGYHLFTGEPAFTGTVDQHQKGDALPAAELAAAGVPDPVIAWLRELADPSPENRPNTGAARERFERIAGRFPGGAGTRPPGPPPAGPDSGADEERDKEWLRNLPPGYPLTSTYQIQEKLGRGGFGVVYRVHDLFAGTDRALKIVLEDPHSLVGRLQQEYRNLLNLPLHENVVRVWHADYVPGTTFPFLVFDYVPGRDVGRLAAARTLGPAAVRGLGIDVARGLAHLHSHDVRHCDIKPKNLMWTTDKAKIIDFNVAVGSEQSLAEAGISWKYAPPDYARRERPSIPDLIDRDVYALGLSLYEALTGAWPWQGIAAAPPADQEARDPREFDGLGDLSQEFVDVLLRAIKPSRTDRYESAERFLAALEAVPDVRRRRPAAEPPAVRPDGDRDNPFVAFLQTLYSQSTLSNSGTRGLDAGEHTVYVPTLLDKKLIDDVLDGKHRLVIITGNAGDGKTALIERLVRTAERRQPGLRATRRANGADFTFGGRVFRTNNDGSQDEGERSNDDVLDDFFAPFAGPDPSAWPSEELAETRLIAINEGRLVDFLGRDHDRFAALEAVRAGTDGAAHGVVIVNLNSRSVIAEVDEHDPAGGSIFDRMLVRMTDNEQWAACNGCALADRCYALHNARTFAHPTMGPQARERLHMLYKLTHLRGKLHITLRDLRSALAFMLTSGRSCSDIRDLYADPANTSAILDAFYFTSWLGEPGTRDRLLTLLREADIRDDADPALDRRLDFAGPKAGTALVPVDQRGEFDQELLASLFTALRRDGGLDRERVDAHRAYVTTARRRYYFESQDPDHWRKLLPYRSIEDLGRLLEAPADPARPEAYEAVGRMVVAINRSEGLADPDRLANQLALAVRRVRNGTIRGYRLFDGSEFQLRPVGPPPSRYVETQPDRLILSHRRADADPDARPDAELDIRLDLFEMLHRLGRGTLPAPSDLQGQHLSLTIFKNMLMTSPYEEVLLTVTGHDMHRVRREPDGTIVMSPEELMPAPEEEMSD